MKKGKGKGTGEGRKGGRGGKNKDVNDSGCKRMTPDGRPICYRFNSPGGCVKDKCNFVHVCGNCCAKDHNLTTCPAK